MSTGRALEVLASVVASVGPLVAGLLLAMLILWSSGYDPVAVLARGFGFSLFCKHGILNTLSAATPLLLTALTFAVGVRTGVFNIAAEGTLMVGAAAAIAAGGLVRMPGVLHHIVVLAAAVGVGMLWNVPIGYAKIRRNVHEVVSSIMLNWVALFLTSFLVVWPLRDPQWPMRSVKILPSARFESLARGSSLSAALPLAVVMAVAVYVLLWHTRTGQHIRATGHNAVASRNCGIAVGRAMFISFAVGGASAGLAGYALTAGLPPLWSVSEKLGTLLGYGFTGICVAAIGRNHPLAIIPSAVLVGALVTSRSYLQMFAKVPPDITDVVVGVVIMAFAVPAFFKMLTKAFRREGSS